MTIEELKVGSRVMFGNYGVDSDRAYPIWWVKATKDCDFITESVLNYLMFDAKEPNSGDYGCRNYGNPNYNLSNIRQFLNSEDEDWYIPQHAADNWPNNRRQDSLASYGDPGGTYRHHHGFLRHFEDYEIYERTTTTGIMLRNGLISLLDQTFPGANKLFRDESRNAKGHVKWVDFIIRFWHKECVAALPLHTFADTFQKWCKRTGYRFSTSDTERIHAIAKNTVATLPKNDSTKLLITQAANNLNAVYDSLQVLRTEMNRLAALLPEYELVMGMEGRW